MPTVTMILLNSEWDSSGAMDGRPNFSLLPRTTLAVYKAMSASARSHCKLRSEKLEW
jgi:hypothetical protein